MKIKNKTKRHDNSQQAFVLSGCIMSDIVFGGRSYIWSTNLGCASVGTPDIRPPPRTISYTYRPRAHKNKSMQHHTLGSGTAEFQVTWPPKLREGTYLVKKCTSTLWVSKDHRRAWKTGHNVRKGAACASLWRKTPRPKRVRFLAIDAPIVDYVCLPFYHLTFLGSFQPLCKFSWRKKKEKAR